MDFELGARGLRSICEAILTDAMFELPSEKRCQNLGYRFGLCKEKTERK